MSVKRSSPKLVDRALIDALIASGRVQAAAIASELRAFNLLCRESRVDLASIVAGRAVERLVRGLCKYHHIDHLSNMEGMLQNLVKNSHIDPVTKAHCEGTYKSRNDAAHAHIEYLVGEIDGPSLVELENVAISLNVVMSWYVRSVLGKLPPSHIFRVIDKHQMTREHLLGATEIGRLSYPEEYHSNHENLWLWHETNKDVFTLVEDPDSKRVIGCLTVLPLHDEAYTRVRSGAIIDTELLPKDIRTFEAPGFYRLYVASLIVHPTYHRTGVFKLLYQSYIEKLLDLAEQELFVTELVADAVTPYGSRMAEWLGMTEVGKSRHNSTIYAIELLPPTKIRMESNSLKKLILYYRAKYKELKELLESRDT